MLPMGLLYAGGICRRAGHTVKIFDPYLEDADLVDFDKGDFCGIDGVIADFKPDIIGYGGIATSYGRVKTLSKHIHKGNPSIMQIAGGALSSVYELLLSHTPVKVVFHGEAEKSLRQFLSRLERGASFDNVNGISFLSNGKVTRTPDPEQIKNLDEIPMPPYDIVDISKYLHPLDAWISHYRVILNNTPLLSNILAKTKGKTSYVPIVSSRGCTHRCSFCYRHTKGYRQHSVGYVISHIKYLKNTCGVSGFQFCDELFNGHPEWVLQFCDALDKEKLDIFYMIGGARVDKMNPHILKRLADTGCIEIGYGHESGSDSILKEFKKGVTRKQNIDITLETKSAGISAPIQLVIGSPSETRETIKETIGFLKETGSSDYSLNYLIALPGAPIWDLVEEKKLVPDLEKYLGVIQNEGGRPVLNLTNAGGYEWREWSQRIRREIKLSLYRKESLPKYYLYKLLYPLAGFVAKYAPARLKGLIPKRLQSGF